MVIEYALQNIDQKLVKIGCYSLEYKIDGRSQFYAGPLQAPL
jgi:hypothetical protein